MNVPTHIVLSSQHTLSLRLRMLSGISRDLSTRALCSQSLWLFFRCHISDYVYFVNISKCNESLTEWLAISFESVNTTLITTIYSWWLYIIVFQVLPFITKGLTLILDNSLSTTPQLNVLRLILLLVTKLNIITIWCIVYLLHTDSLHRRLYL